MSINRKIILISFASSDLKKSIDRLKKQAYETKFYDEIKIITEDDLDNDFKIYINKIMSGGNKRGYGYFIWKPYIIKKILSEINYGDIINYVDVGFHVIKENSKKFKDYIKFISEKDKWILPFQYHTKLNEEIEKISFPHREERKYSKGDLLDYYGFYNSSIITETPQYMAGCFFIKKCDESINFINEWLEIFYKRIDLVNDTKSKLKNLNGFLENRHDQSVFSILCKKYNLISFSAYECDWAYLNNKRTWIHNKTSPLIARRDLHYNLLRRFLNRQKKNFLRKKKYITNLLDKYF